MESDTPTLPEASGKTRTGIIGTLVALYPVVDGYVFGLPVVVLAASTRPVVVFAVAAAFFLLLNLACCRWVNTHWTQFAAGSSGARVEKRLEKMRSGGLMRRPVGWIERGSDAQFALASMLLNAVWVVAFARILGGKPVSRRRIVIASAAYAVGAAGVESLVGWLLGGLVSSAM